MNVLFAVHRYGEGISGGAEGACRELATRLVGRGHGVEVATSRAVSYVGWHDELPLGDGDDHGVRVHRLSVIRPRDPERFDRLNRRVTDGYGDVAPELEDAWMEAQGPVLDGYQEWLAANAARFDVVVFLPYLYWTTWTGLPIAGARAATVMHPAAHDEPHLLLPMFRLAARSADALGFFTPEEEALVRTRLGLTDTPGAVTGLGVDPPPAVDVDRFRRTWRLGDDPYLVYVGRLDPSKGADTLATQFAAYKQRRPGPLRLVLVGDPVYPIDAHPDIVVTGFADEATKHAALAGAVALVQPSHYESFSIVLAEAWSHGTPALVQRASAVLEGQCRRSGGGIPYGPYVELEAAIDLLIDNGRLRRRLGDAGRRYGESELSWPKVLDRYETLLAAAVAGRREGVPTAR
ncbi:MAG TPA: glycosyltransferase family 4 protein [Acidimicrobiales bacterium]|nr:glycosyltransferase family 4 protein [Acidimicrobiales bacterium]